MQYGDSADNDDELTLHGVRFAVIQTLVILTTIKWVLLSILAGALVGVPTAVFLLLLDGGIDIVYDLPYFYLLIPLGFLMSYLLVSRLAPDAKGHGTEQVIDAIHHHNGAVKLAVVPVKMVATLITLILGGSAGKEGPSAQIGAGVASGFARLLKLNKLDTQRFVLCGISAGFSGVFGTPIAGAIFASEVLSIGRFHYNRLLPALIASYVSTFITRSLGVRHLSFAVDTAVSGDLSMLAQMVGFGLVMGLLAILFIAILNRTESIFEHVQLPGSLKAILGGLILIGVVIVTGTTNYIGLGMEIIDSALDGESYRGIAPLFKMFTTSVTLSAGGSGGILTPIFFIGATAGNIFAQLFGMNLAIYSAIGMVAFLAATTNTPIAAVLMAIELFGITTGSWAAIAAAVSYLIVGHLSVFPSQIIFQKKTFFTDLEEHDIPVRFSAAGIRRIFGAFFRGYRNERDEGLNPGGISVAEHERSGLEDQLRPRTPNQSYYPLSTVPHVPESSPGPAAQSGPEGSDESDRAVMTDMHGGAGRAAASGRTKSTSEKRTPSVEEAHIMQKQIEELREMVDNSSRICVLTGAGISAECGIPTFRDSQTGYWARFDPTQLATLEAFNRHPARSWSWYAARRMALRSVAPGEGHLALARMEGFVERVTVVTQNVDGLHERAGSQRVLNLHGNLLRVRCVQGCTIFHRDADNPTAREVFSGDIAAAFAAEAAEEDSDFSAITVPKCPECGSYLRPDVIWFGEMLPADTLDKAFSEAERCDLFLIIGTSAMVQPAASLPMVARERGTRVVEINPDRTILSDKVTLTIRGEAGYVLSHLI